VGSGPGGGVVSAVNPASEGWIGRASELHSVLQSFHCDRTPDGQFCVAGSITSFMGAGDDFVVAPDALFFVDGKPHNLCAALGVTSYGMGVTVIA